MDDVEPRGELEAYYSLCTPDCEGGVHVGEWKTCDRCGSLIHKRVFEVSHPTYGFITVGSECFKDVMGYSFNTSHEKAIETRAAIVEWMGYFEKEVSTSPHPLPGRLVAVVMPGPVSGAKRVGALMLLDRGGRTFQDVTGTYYGVRGHNPPTPHGWSKTIITAGLDLGLWEEVEYTEYSGLVHAWNKIVVRREPHAD